MTQVIRPVPSRPAVFVPAEGPPLPEKFKPWKFPPLASCKYRPNRPILEMTKGLAKLYESCKKSSEDTLERRMAVKEMRWVNHGDQLLGEGTYAKVIAMKDMQTQRLVAGKICKAPANSTNLAIAENERQILHIGQSCRHVIRFYGGCRVQVEGRANLLLVMDRISFTFSKLVCIQKRLPFLEVLSLFRQLLEFYYDFSHLGMIHGDLSYRNIAWERGALTVFDFGISIREDVVSSNSGGSIQSLIFRAPEVLLGQTCTSSIDLWSIGCVVYRAYTGEDLVWASEDNPQWQLDVLAQIILKTKGEECFYFDGTRVSASSLAPYIRKYKGKLKPFVQVLDEEAKRRDLRPAAATAFSQLLQKALQWENRPSSAEALALCHQIIKTTISP